MVFLYAFIAVLCLGIAPFFGKSIINSVNPLTAFGVRTVIAAILVVGWMVLNQSYFEVKGLSWHFWVTVTLEAAIAAVLADLAYFYALKNGTINQVALIISCSPLVTMTIGYFAFDELISWKQIAGALFLTIGLVFINLDS